VDESHDSFRCFGGTCTLHVMGEGSAEAVRPAREQLLDWHHRFSRFELDSELSLLNSDPRTAVPVSHEMAAFVEAALRAARLTAGLVDPTLLAEIRDSGYERHAERPLPLGLSLQLKRRRTAARPHPSARWRTFSVERAGRVIRPPGVQLDSGGIAKGLFADLLGRRLGDRPGFAVDCAGDIRLGGVAELPRAVRVESPFDGGILHEFELVGGGVATSGIGRRSWLGADGRPAHHLLDPATGRPAFTGVVQATALAPTAVEAEARAKAAVLDGPERAAHWLRHGGLVVHDDGSHRFQVDSYTAPTRAA
jgi:thiamine biosynthesis lipoprotein